MSSAFGASALIAEDIDAYLHQHRHKSLLRFITCGSVDDGKSTLIGRLLYEGGALFDDQLAALKADSGRVGTQGEELDFALLLDGLAAEREQGITIDVAYRFFGTERRKYIVADTPGHEQYTRNMVTGASTADLAVILIDARKGVLKQTRRHSYLVHLLGIRRIVLAVNKLDLVGYSQAVFESIVADYRGFAAGIGIDTGTGTAPGMGMGMGIGTRTGTEAETQTEMPVGIGKFMAIPISGLKGDNITERSVNMPWYRGPSLLEHLDTVELDSTVEESRPFRMAVQWVNRSSADFRGYSGLIGAGVVRVGDAVRSVLSGGMSTVSRIVVQGGDLSHAMAGQSVTLCLADEIDCSRGDVLASSENAPTAADQFEAGMVWMGAAPLLPGRQYWLKLAAQTVTATVQAPKYQIDIHSLERVPGKTLELNGIGVVTVATQRPIVYEPYDTSRALGGFILIDKATNATVAAGMLHFALRRSLNVHRQATDIGRAHHAAIKNQRAAVLWFTGLSGAGKSTIANLVEKRLARMNRHTFLLDGDNVRTGLNRDLGFTEANRIENIRRVGEVARLMADAGLIVITALISPFRAERQMVREMLAPEEFFEIYVDTPLSEAERRDVKGLYKKARAGELKNFTGIDSPYEVPEGAELRIDTTAMTAEQAAEFIVERVIG
jgi:bifunctional enzyme CysN/CysC